MSPIIDRSPQNSGTLNPIDSPLERLHQRAVDISPISSEAMSWGHLQSKFSIATTIEYRSKLESGCLAVQSWQVDLIFSN